MINTQTVRVRPSEPRYLKDPFVFCCCCAVLLGAGYFAFWSATAQLAQGITASGVLIAENRRFPVQHLEGGIIQEISIREGVRASAGDLAMVISDATSVARLSQTRAEMRGLLALLDRITSQLNGAETVQFDRLRGAVHDESEIEELIELNVLLFEDQRAALRGEKALVNAKIARLNAQLELLAARRIGKTREIETLNEERSIQDRALSQQLGNVSRVNELLRLLAIAETQLAEVGEEEQVVAQSIIEAELELRQLDLTFRVARSKERAEAARELAAVSEELAALEDRRFRSNVVVPVDGTVIDLLYTAVGGIIAPGERIFDIVPSRATQQVEVRFLPGDRDDLSTNKEVNLRFGTLDPINPPEITGILETIAADATLDQQSGAYYYLATVAVTRQDVARLSEEYQITPGIPVEVFFDKGAPRTPISYFLQPIAEMLRNGMRS